MVANENIRIRDMYQKFAKKFGVHYCPFCLMSRRMGKPDKDYCCHSSRRGKGYATHCVGSEE